MLNASFVRSRAPERRLRARAARLPLPALVVVGGLVEPVGAQTIPSSYSFIQGRQEVSILSGVLPLEAGSMELGPQSGPVVGARYAIEAVGPLFFEGVVTYSPTQRSVIDPRRARDDWSIGESPVHLLMADARLDFSLTGRRTWRRISPHLYVGAGLASDLASEGELDRNLLPEDVYDFGTRITASGGSGLRLSLTRKLMLRAEVGMTMWKINTPGGFDDSTKRPENEQEDPLLRSEWVRGYGLTLGLGWRF